MILEIKSFEPKPNNSLKMFLSKIKLGLQFTNAVYRMKVQTLNDICCATKAQIPLPQKANKIPINPDNNALDNDMYVCFLKSMRFTNILFGIIDNALNNNVIDTHLMRGTIVGV